MLAKVERGEVETEGGDHTPHPSQAAPSQQPTIFLQQRSFEHGEIVGQFIGASVSSMAHPGRRCRAPRPSRLRSAGPRLRQPLEHHREPQPIPLVIVDGSDRSEDVGIVGLILLDLIPQLVGYVPYLIRDRQLGPEGVELASQGAAAPSTAAGPTPRPWFPG